MNVVEPLLDRRFISDSYASRRGKGVHAAVRRYRQWAKRYDYALKLDIQRYFDSIDHRLLEGKIARHLGDAELRWLFQTIIASSPEPLHPCVVPAADDDLVDLMERRIGLPLGNLTSQFLGNLYLDDLDHYVKETLRVPAYLRYVDDLVLLGNDKTELWGWCRAIEDFLAGQRLRVHPRKRLLTPVHGGLDVLGYRADRRSTRLGRGSGYRFRRRLRQWSRRYAAGRLSLAEIRTHIAGWIGHAVQADTWGLRRAVLSGIRFGRGGSAERWPGGSRRFVEQQPTEPAIGQPQQEQDR
jgi:hypothetical protein